MSVYRAKPRRIHSGCRSRLVFLPSSGHTRPIDVRRLKLAGLCDRWDTLAGHAARIRQTLSLPASAGPELLQRLESLVADGLLRSRASEGASRRLSIEHLAIPTRNRPAALDRCLRSHALHLRDRTLTFGILQSSSDDHSSATRTAVDEVAATLGIRVQMATAADKQRFADRIAKEAQLPPGLVAFALTDSQGCEHDTGSNRNALLLGHAGLPFLSTDDDVVCEPRTYVRREGLRFSSSGDPTDLVVVESLAAGRNRTFGDRRLRTCVP